MNYACRVLGNVLFLSALAIIGYAVKDKKADGRACEQMNQMHSTSTDSNLQSSKKGVEAKVIDSNLINTNGR